MKKLLTILTMLLATVSIYAETETTLWEGTYTEGIELNSETVATFKTGDKLRVYLTVPEGGANFKICYKGPNNEWAETAIPSFDNQWPWVNYSTGTEQFDISFTEADITAFTGNNIYIYKGDNSTITKVTLIASPSYDGTVIYNEGDVVMGTAWDKYIQLSADKFSELNPGAVIRVYIKDVLDDVQAIFQDGSWQDIEGVDAISPASTDTNYELTLTSSVLTIIQEKGLIVKGKNFTATAVSIMSTGTAVTLYTLTINQPETGGKIKKGDADAETAQYEAGSEVTLTASASEGYTFKKWSDGTNDLTAESDGSLKVTMDADKTVTAVFESTAIPAFSLDGFVADDGNSYNASTHTLTTASGWSGMQLWIGDYSTYSGSKLLVKTSEDCKLKITVGYIGGGQAEISDESASTKHSVTLDNTKKIQKVIIQNQEAGTVTFTEFALDPTYTLTITEPSNGSFTVNDGTNNLATGASVAYGTTLTLTATPASDYSFSKWTVNGTDYTDNPQTITMTEATTIAATFTANAIPAFSLDGFTADDGNTYNATTHELTTASGWSGMNLWIGDNSTYPGGKLVVRTSTASKLKVMVYYVGVESPEEMMDSETATAHSLTLDNTKKIKSVIIQNQEAGTVTFTEFALDPTYTLTITEPSNGSFTVNDGTNNLATGASVAYGTTLTLTATPASDYSFSKWTVNGTDYTDNPQTITMTEATTIAATFTAVSVITPVFTDGVADLSKFEVQDADKVTYDTESHKITVTEGWTGVQITATSADDVQGKELRITFSEAAKVKATVKYADETATDSIMAESATILYMVINGTKKISQIQIQPTEAGSITLNEVKVNAESTKPADPVTPDEPSQTGVNITLDDLNEGWNSTYDATTHTINITSEWGARGWYIGDDRYNNKGSVTVKFNAVTFPVTLKMEYTNTEDESKDTSTGSAAGETEVTVDIPSNIKTMDKVYITFESVGELVLTAVMVNDKVVDNRTEKTMVEKSQAIADGDIEINRGLFSNAAVGDVLRIYATGLSEASKIAIEPNDYSGALDGANWTGFTESPFTLKLTSALLEIVKAKNLLIRGENYTFTKAALYTENNLGEVINDTPDTPGEPDNPEEPDGDTTFDKNGEADLTELKGQDDKTSVTSNSDGSVTITTTEPYKAAQIWFNNPEKVTGNVLRVEIAESNVDVTVTVRYTDGSQSQMSSTASASARAMTRATAGTIIKVPVESGKNVQSIEVKNAKAGTITVKKMAMVTQSVFDTDGEADLSMLKPQSNATYDVSTHTLATTQGWTGATLTPLSSESVSGEEVLVRFSSSAQVKVAVKYRTNVDGPSTIMDAPATSVRLTIDKTKAIQEITIQPTTASILTFQEIKVNSTATKDDVEQIFNNGKADLSKFVAQDASKTIYDKDKHIIRATEGWTGVELNLSEGQEVSGKELKISFDGEAKVKVSVTYTDGKATTLIMEDPDEVLRMEIDSGKAIRKIEIQPTEPGNITLKEVAVNKEPEDISLKENETRDLWKSGSGEILNWNETAHQKKSVGSLLQEFDEILITVSGVVDGNEWPKVFLRDLQSNQIGKEVLLNDVTTFPYVVRIPLNSTMAEQIQKGFCICGDGVTVTKLQVYRPYAPKRGDIHLKALDYGYGSSYDATTYTITTTTRWAARGWEIGDMRYNSKDLVIVRFETVDFPVTIKMEYVDSKGQKQATSTGVAAGNTAVEMAIPEGIKQLDKVYLIFQNPGSITMTEATVVTKAEAHSRGFINDGTDGTTGIETITPAYSEDEEGWYDLNGRRVNQPSKGIYIKSGKKIFVK